MITVDYRVPDLGLATDFSQSEQPLRYARELKNRFTNVNGALERRPGLSRTLPKVPGDPNLTRGHEWVGKDGTEVLMASDKGNIWKYSATASAWEQVVSGKSIAHIESVQAGDKLIFYNGVDRNFYTDDGGASFKELYAVIARGTSDSGSDYQTLVDGNVSNWLTETNVANNDIVYNITHNAYGIVTAIVTGAISHTIIGIGGNGAGKISTDASANNAYVVIDHVDCNIIPDGTGSYDNVATLSTAQASWVEVSGVNFTGSELRRGDIVYNTTRAAVSLVNDVSARITLQQPITGQVAGDSIAIFKSAMPITHYAHVHYGRVYYHDARDKNRIIISAPDAPDDVTTFAKTLESSSQLFGSLQPRGDLIKASTTFQRYLVVCGSQYIYIFDGVDPIRDASGDSQSFTPVAIYPVGLVGRLGLANAGNNVVYVSRDGLLAVALGSDNLSTIQNNISDVIRTRLQQQIANASEDDIQAIYYPRRSWLMLKIGSEIFNLNLTTVLGQSGERASGASWSVFDGAFAQQNFYMVRRNGDLVAFGPAGNVYNLDDGSVTDNGTRIRTELVPAFYNLEEPNRTVRIKKGTAIKPIFESGQDIVYTIGARAGYDNLAQDTALVTAEGGAGIGSAIVGVTPIGGTGVQEKKVPLRWRGKEVQLTITTESSASPDIITGYTLYGMITGRR